MRIGSLIGGVTVSCDPTMTVRDAAAQMSQGEQGSLLVMSSDKLVGIVTERDILTAVASGVDLDSMRVAECMTPEPDTASPELEVREAAEWMVATGYRHLPVAVDDEIVGVMSMKDVLWAMTEPANG